MSLFLLWIPAWYGAGAADSAAIAHGELGARLKTIFPDIEVTRITPAPIPGLYEVLVGTDVLYVSADGRYLIQGDLLDLGKRRNITESQRALLRVNRLSAEPLADMIEFAPPDPRHVVYIFTDIQCGYCRRLHREMSEINKRGIAVRYLAYPRAGVGSEAFIEMESIWCSPDRRKALTDAKLGKVPAQKNCPNPVGRQLALGESLGVRGTPAIYTSAGRALPGYMPPDELLAMLEQKPD
jgi:thiol:disulfide interchange protein DsbC